MPRDHRGRQRRRRDGQAATRQPRPSRTGRCASQSTTASSRATGSRSSRDWRPSTSARRCRTTATQGVARGSSPARHLERIESLLAEARTEGATCGRSKSRQRWIPTRRQLPLSLVIDPPDDLALMREEIFGPILPVKPYDELDEAIGRRQRRRTSAGALRVREGRRPPPTDVLRRTTSGGACVNAAAVHGALPSLPFGGIGQSGSGRHHGIEGFREFSNLRGVFVRGEGDLIEAFAPPYGPTADCGGRWRVRCPG